MGEGYSAHCSKCIYSFSAMTGIGYMFPQVYKDLIKKARNGKLGPELGNFFKEHKDGAIDASEAILCCESCGELSNKTNLTMYVPKEKGTPLFALKREDCVFPTDLKEHYIEYSKYPHKCDECGGNMRVVDDYDEIVCPICKEPMKLIETCMWD